MTGSLALDLWILVPLSLFVLVALYVVRAGRRMGGVDFRVPRAGRRRGRRAPLVNVVSRAHRPVDATGRPAEVIDTVRLMEAARAAMGPERTRA